MVTLRCVCRNALLEDGILIESKLQKAQPDDVPEGLPWPVRILYLPSMRPFSLAVTPERTNNTTCLVLELWLLNPRDHFYCLRIVDYGI